jgi:lipase chaperone LimK
MIKKIKTKQWLTLLVTVFFVSAIYYFQKDDEKNHPTKLTASSIEEPEETQETVVELKVGNINRELTNPQNLVKTYDGSQPDGAIHLDANGKVIIDKDLKRLFDYYLSAIGELPLDQMRKYLQQFASEQLNPDQLQQLLDYFDQYHNYLNKADLFAESIGDDLSMQEKMKLLSEFRTESLGIEMAEAFFGSEQQYIEFVMTEKNSEEWTAQQQQWLQAENQATEFQDVVLENQEFANTENLNSTEVYQYRVEEYGQEAADRLSQLDQQRAQWQTVVDSYFQQRQQIENQQGSISIEQLNSNYTPQDMRRLEALWRIDNH